MVQFKFLSFCLLGQAFLSFPALALSLEAVWDQSIPLVSGEPRANIYKWDETEFKARKESGQKDILSYPISVSGMLFPMPSFEKIGHLNPLKTLFSGTPLLIGAGNLTDIYRWLGLVPYPNVKYAQTDPFFVSRPSEVGPQFYLGVNSIPTAWGPALTMSCATCHASQFFGHAIIGLPNKQIRANQMFSLVKQLSSLFKPVIFQPATGATPTEIKMLSRTMERIRSIGPIDPQVLGLDSSLAHVGRSLARRNPDPEATFSCEFQKHPRPHQLDHWVADSKPGVWWVVKYKNRWLLDGSVVSGNPILTNFIWNEVGRGTDLRELETWLDQNPEIAKNIATRVFASEAPRWHQIFPQFPLHLERAKRGEALFERHCSRCHGVYEKAWSHPELAAIDPFLTTKITYFEQTPVMDVGTDPQRAEGMRELSDQLNQLRLAQRFGIRVVPQKGYVPPPLEGIFARYPYFHNNSAPSLCAVLTPAEKRPRFFIQGPAENAERDFDPRCVGYPVGNVIPLHWYLNLSGYYDTSKAGLRNSGHDRMLKKPDGREWFSAEEKFDLVEFLKTL